MATHCRYIFSSRGSRVKRVLGATSSGSACVNECGVVPGNPNVPFGGVGASGMGSYHGKFDFDAFSHKKTVIVKIGTDLALRFPPYTATKTRLLLTAMRVDINIVKRVGWVCLVLIIVTAAVVVAWKLGLL